MLQNLAAFTEAAADRWLESRLARQRVAAIVNCAQPQLSNLASYKVKNIHNIEYLPTPLTHKTQNTLPVPLAFGMQQTCHVLGWSSLLSYTSSQLTHFVQQRLSAVNSYCKPRIHSAPQFYIHGCIGVTQPRYNRTTRRQLDRILQVFIGLSSSIFCATYKLCDNSKLCRNDIRFSIRRSKERHTLYAGT